MNKGLKAVEKFAALDTYIWNNNYKEFLEWEEGIDTNLVITTNYSEENKTLEITDKEVPKSVKANLGDYIVFFHYGFWATYTPKEFKEEFLIAKEG